MTDLSRRAVAEALGTAILLATVVGSGIMGERLANGDVAIALLANTLATGAILVTLILTFGPVSGAHFNPAVTMADASQGGLPWRDVAVYIAAPNPRRFCGSGRRPPDVRRISLLRLTQSSRGRRADVQRVRGDVRVAGGDLGSFTAQVERGAFCGGGLHHCGLLVHGFDFVRKSCGHAGASG